MRIIEPIRKKQPLVHVYFDSRQIHLNPPSVKMLGLKSGDNILFGHDDDNEEIFYLIKTKKGLGFEVALYNKNGSTKSEKITHLKCHSVEFVRLLIETFKVTSKNITLMISPKPILKDGLECYVLIHNSLSE